MSALPTQAPFSQEAEEAVLGAILINPDSYLTIASFLTTDDFFILRHRHIWDALSRISQRNEKPDFVTVQDELRAMGQLNEIGGPAFILNLINNTPTSIHVEVYAHLVERASTRRKLLTAADQIKGLALDETLNLERVVSEAETRLFGVTETTVRRDVQPISAAINEYFERVELLMQSPTAMQGLPTGFRDLDELLGGLQRSDLLIFAGRPGMGKTSFLLSVALNAAKVDARIAIFTMEMGADQIVQRFLAMESGINTQKLRTGHLSQQEYSKFVHSAGNLGILPIFIDDTPSMTPVQMRTKCRRIQHEFGLDLVIVDYLQLMSGGGTFENNRVQEISYISRNLKEMARELQVPVFSAAQLSRAVEQRQDKHPQLSDLRESGSLEQDADIVAFLYREVVYNEAAENPNKADVIIAKHRNGPTGSISLHYENQLTKFLDARPHKIDLSSY
ncbi:MAG: replicative DNA helicase [Anaerolineae bacterium]|nr:replicative DNA helicase [Anaerolineae bacterium]